MSSVKAGEISLRTEAKRRGAAHYVTVGLASLMGTTIEWYDFFLYGTAAALVFNKLFFPNLDPLLGTLAAFGTYAVGFFARPFGGLLFGHFGDRVGRKSMLMITLFLMGIPTTLIGLVPTYDQIGLWAPLTLVTLRLIQGISIGGEWGGAVLMSIEHAPEGKKGLFGALPQAGVGFGLVLSSLAMAWVSKLPESDLFSWGWRVPFLASAILLLLGWYIRVRIAESPAFEKFKSEGREVKVPALEVIKSHPGATLRVIGARIAEVTWFYTVVTFTLSYAANTLGIPKPMILNAIVFGAATIIFTIPFFGHLGDRVGQKWLYAIGTVCLIGFAFPFFQLLQQKTELSIWLAIIPALSLIYSIMYGPQSTMFAAQYPAEVRYSGISLAVQVSGAIGGGLAPIVATALLAANGGATNYLSWYLIGLGVVAFLCSVTMRNKIHD
ncbi:MFS transporter [uncultured Propionivibrio sp.]|uniref:MFS transporter n=1 Tax=uncultured Propionivibrio sp. TaxID=426737 RepID=UPI0029C0B903|nr:MFS transporter [uncultured Propionivibrio sp.]